MSKVKLKVGIVLIFLLGCLAGGLAMEYYHQYKKGDRPRRRPTLSQRVDFITKRLTKDLDLREDQIGGIRAIVQKSEQAIAALKDGIRPQVRELHDQSFQAIRLKLDPGQQEKLDQLIERLKKFSRRSKAANPPVKK